MVSVGVVVLPVVERMVIPVPGFAHHTSVSLRSGVEEDPGLAIPPKINSFADNGHTSPDQLRNTYLRYIDAERTARESRQTIGEGKWTMVKRTDQDY